MTQCSPILNPICHGVSNIGSDVFGAGANTVLSAVTGWVASGAVWLLDQVGTAMNSTSTVDIGASWFTTHFEVMVGISAAVVVPLLMLAVIQAIVRQDGGVLIKSFLVQLPMAALFSGVAIELVQLALAATDALSATVSAGSGGQLSEALAGLGKAILSQIADGSNVVPAFIILGTSLLVAMGGFTLWLELLLRSAALSVAVLFLPLAFVSLVWPAISHWCRRLVETLAALILSKFVIVSIMSLAVSAMASGSSTGISAILEGAALLLLASFTPFALLRLIPVIEAGAVQHLEGARQRLQQSVTAMPRAAASVALRTAAMGAGAEFDVGMVGSGLTPDFGAPGPCDDFGAGSFGTDEMGFGGGGGSAGAGGGGSGGGGSGGRSGGGFGGGGWPGGGDSDDDGPVIMGPHTIPWWKGTMADPLEGVRNGPVMDNPEHASVTGRPPYPFYGTKPNFNPWGEEPVYDTPPDATIVKRDGIPYIEFRDKSGDRNDDDFGNEGE